MLKNCFYASFKSVLLLTTALSLPLSLRGQDGVQEPFSASIIGDAFVRLEYRDPTRFNIMTYYNQSGILDVTLITDKDTLRTKTTISGRFSIMGITASRVTLFITPQTSWADPFSGTFELMPGENIVVVPMERTPFPGGSPMQVFDGPIMTAEGDTWIYHYPYVVMTDGYAGGVPNYEEYEAISRLKGIPGVKLDARKHELYISGEAVHRTFVNGAYVFGLNPDAAE